ncbi:MAG: carbohydrate ABC transporter permease [Spirochaetaceae bacterium]|nr:MAG: carbohydrate ABC transporter permease [Spirochaetaceae bacterium]
MIQSKVNRIRNAVLFHSSVVILGFFMLYPLLWMISNSFKPNDDIFGTASLIPSTIVLDNYVRGWNFVGNLNFGMFFLNSFFYAGVSTIGAVLSSALVAFGFARIRFFAKNFWFVCMLVTMMIPFQVVMIPQYLVFRSLGWVNSYAPLIIPMFMGQPFFIFLMLQFIRGIPLELDESARIDGCGYFRIFAQIIFPLITPALITSAIFNFYWRWDDFLGPLLYLNKPQMYTVSIALRMFSDPSSSTDWGAIFSMATLSLLPILIVFIVFQKYIVQGISTTGIKG